MNAEEEIKKEFAVLATKLNELMNQDSIADMDEKLIPYLGWVWRDITPEIPRFVLSWHEGHWWIDEARKWGYPSKMIEGEEAIKLLKMCITTVELGGSLNEWLRENPPEVT